MHTTGHIVAYLERQDVVVALPKVLARALEFAHKLIALRLLLVQDLSPAATGKATAGMSRHYVEASFSCLLLRSTVVRTHLLLLLDDLGFHAHLAPQRVALVLNALNDLVPLHAWHHHASLNNQHRGSAPVALSLPDAPC